MKPEFKNLNKSCLQKDISFLFHQQRLQKCCLLPENWGGKGGLYILSHGGDSKLWGRRLDTSDEDWWSKGIIYFLRELSQLWQPRQEKRPSKINICAIVTTSQSTHFVQMIKCWSRTPQPDCKERSWNKCRKLKIYCCLLKLSSKTQMW